MANMKPSKTFFFTVEGETEKWYLEWLQKQINECEEATYRAVFDCQIQKNPLKRAKSLTVTTKTVLYHLSDYESNELIHVRNFKSTMDNLKAASKLGKEIKCQFGYTNLTFDLWIILHKIDCRTSFSHRKYYITPINNAFNESFENMDIYKHERNFKRILSKISLADVKNAINRAKSIQNKNADNGYTLHQYKGYKYYEENPSLEIGNIIQNIFKECGIL